MNYFKANSVSDINKLILSRNNLEGCGWGEKVKSQIEALDRYPSTSKNSLIVVLTDFRRYNYFTVAVNSWRISDADIETFVEDPI